MYTRSRSSSGGPGFGNGRGQMNPGNGNSFQGSHPYNHQGGNYQQSNYKPGIIQPSAPFKPSGPPTPVQQQGMKPRPGNQQHQNQQHQNQQHQGQQHQGQQHQNQQHQNQPNQSPPVQKLKPILKQSSLNVSSGPAQPSAAPSPVPPPSANNPSAPATPANTPANSTPTTPAATPSPANVTAAAAVPPATPTTPTAPSAAAAVTAAKPAVVNAPAKGEPTPTKVVAAADKTADATVNKPADTTGGKTADATNISDASGNTNADPTGNENDSTAEKKGDSAADQSVEPMEGDDPRRWVEDEDQGRWMETDDQSCQWQDTEDGQVTPKARREEWRRIKRLTTKKPNKVLKRLRMNRRLRKTLMPKNALMVLNEMKAGVNFTFPETQAIMPNSLFLVHAELEGKVYVGQGLSKPLARQNAAENALKCLLLEKMTAAAMKERVETEGEAAMEVGENQSTTEVSNEENGEEAVEENDDIPWSSLASFALYKLFLEWQNQGTVVPIPRPGGPPLPKNRAEPKTLTDKVLPTNALDIHPVMLLNQMRPGTTYNEVGRVGNPPNIQFTLGVEINGKAYTGTAKNKKDAKKIAAKEALKDLYNLEYPDEPKLEIVEPAPQ